MPAVVVGLAQKLHQLGARRPDGGRQVVGEVDRGITTRDGFGRFRRELQIGRRISVFVKFRIIETCPDNVTILSGQLVLIKINMRLQTLSNRRLHFLKGHH